MLFVRASRVFAINGGGCHYVRVGIARHEQGWGKWPTVYILYNPCKLFLWGVWNEGIDIRPAETSLFQYREEVDSHFTLKYII